MINRRIVSLGTRSATISSCGLNPQLSSEGYTPIFRSWKRKLPKKQRNTSEVEIMILATGWSEPVPGRIFSPAEDQRVFTAHFGHAPYTRQRTASRLKKGVLGPLK